MTKCHSSRKSRCLALVFAAGMVYAGLLLKASSPEGDHPRLILTSAHRGEHLHHPENSIPAIEAAIAAGMDFVELDIRTTADGKLVLMHDRTVDRMTDGKGLVKDKALAEIKGLDLGVRFPGQFVNLRVPTFDEALEAAHGKIGIYVDTKDAAPQDLIAAIERHDMGKHVMFWSEHPDFLSQIRELLGFDQRDFNDATISAARDAKVGIFVDRQTPEEWQDAIDRGATGIQTNYPVELMTFLRAKGLHK